MISSRRSFLAGLGAALITAPAIVRVSSIMPVKQVVEVPDIIHDMDGLARILSARIDDAHAMQRTEHDERLYRRYAEYDAVEFDPDLGRYRTADESSDLARRVARVDLFELRSKNWARHDPEYYQDCWDRRWNRST